MKKIAADKNYYIAKGLLSKEAALSGYYTGLKKHNWKGRIVIGCPSGDDSDYCKHYREKFAAFAEAWVKENEGLHFWSIMGPLQDTNSGEFYSWFNSLFQDWVDESGIDEDGLIGTGEKISGSDVHDKFVELKGSTSLTEWEDGTSVIEKMFNEVTQKSQWGVLCQRLADAFNG